MTRGLFIVLEGPDGAGKSIQAKLLCDWLRDRGLDVIQTREPGGTPAGDAIREILLQSDHLHLARETEALLMAASRAQHVRELIEPALAIGTTVVSDRYVDSSYAYQGGGRQISMDALRSIQAFATGGLVPDIRILLDLPVEVGLARRHGDADQVNRIDVEPVDFHQRVRDAFLALAAANSDGWVVIDGTQDVTTVAQRVQTVIEQRLLRADDSPGAGAATS